MVDDIYEASTGTSVCRVAKLLARTGIGCLFGDMVALYDITLSNGRQAVGRYRPR
jgi:hypothetical protein